MLRDLWAEPFLSASRAKLEREDSEDDSEVVGGGVGHGSFPHTSQGGRRGDVGALTQTSHGVGGAAQGRRPCAGMPFQSWMRPSLAPLFFVQVGVLGGFLPRWALLFQREERRPACPPHFGILSVIASLITCAL